MSKKSKNAKKNTESGASIPDKFVKRVIKAAKDAESLVDTVVWDTLTKIKSKRIAFVEPAETGLDQRGLFGVINVSLKSTAKGNWTYKGEEFVQIECHRKRDRLTFRVEGVMNSKKLFKSDVFYNEYLSFPEVLTFFVGEFYGIIVTEIIENAVFKEC